MAYGFKTGGRQKGSLNKKTLEQREKLTAVWEAELDSGQLREMLAGLSPKDYISAFIKMTGFILPRATEENCTQLPATQPGEPEEPKQPAQLQPVNEGDQVGLKQMSDIFKPGAVVEVKPEDVERFRTEMGWSQERVENFLRSSPFVIKE